MNREELFREYGKKLTEPPSAEFLRTKRLELGDEEYIWWCLAGSYTLRGCEHWWEIYGEEFQSNPEEVISRAERYLQ